MTDCSPCHPDCPNSDARSEHSPKYNNSYTKEKKKKHQNLL